MSENTRFDIIFSGEITAEHPLSVVKQKVALLFKLEASRVEQLFANGQVALKQNLDTATAEKYRQVLTKAGMVVAVIPQAATKAPSWDIAEVGVRLSEPAKSVAPSSQPNSHISVAAQEGNILRPEEVPQVAVAIALSDIEDWDLSQVGDDLLKAAEKVERAQLAQGQAIEVDIDYITVAEKEGDLLKDNEKKKVATNEIDTSTIQLVDKL